MSIYILLLVKYVAVLYSANWRKMKRNGRLVCNMIVNVITKEHKAQVKDRTPKIADSYIINIQFYQCKETFVNNFLFFSMQLVRMKTDLFEQGNQFRKNK